MTSGRPLPLRRGLRPALGRCAAAALALLTIPVARAFADGSPPPSAPRAVTWSELHFAARKLGISASIVVRLSSKAERPDRTGGAGILGPPGAGEGDLVLESTTHLPGRTFVAREVLDPATLGAREIVDTETGLKHHRKTYTLSSSGYQLDIREPASVKEMLLPPERWSRELRSFSDYPLALPAGSVVTGPAGLIVVASAADLSKVGETATAFVLVQTQVERVTVRVDGVAQADLDFEEESAGRSIVVHERRRVERLVVHGEPIDPAAASLFRLFGLEGDVTILWDPVHRLPVELAGQVKMLGHVVVHLASVTLQ
jgi:hypothetical protein